MTIEELQRKDEELQILIETANDELNELKEKQKDLRERQMANHRELIIALEKRRSASAG